MPGKMTRTVPVLFFVTIFSLLVASALPCFSGDNTFSDPAQTLTTFGTIGPNAVQLRVWTNKPPKREFSPGDPVQIHFSADRDCYLAILNVSKSGDVAVFFPNRETPNNAVKGGVEYTLFGDHSSVKLAMDRQLAESVSVLYVSPEPFSLDPLKISESKDFVTLSPRDNNWKVLTSALREISQKPGYNRISLYIRGRAEAPSVRSKGPLRQKSAPAPYKSESEIPETVTGTQGVKPKLGR